MVQITPSVGSSQRQKRLTTDVKCPRRTAKRRQRRLTRSPSPSLLRALSHTHSLPPPPSLARTRTLISAGKDSGSAFIPQGYTRSTQANGAGLSLPINTKPSTASRVSHFATHLPHNFAHTLGPAYQARKHPTDRTPRHGIRRAPFSCRVRPSESAGESVATRRRQPT